MDRKQALEYYVAEIEEIKQRGTFKAERILTTPQSGVVATAEKTGLVNMCANNYLGLCDNKEIIDAAKSSYDDWGFGMSSVRFICGTLPIHKELEKRISAFLGTEDTILYSSCFDANGGLFETLLGEEDAVISDELNHASIIDGIRLCKAQRHRYKNNNMQDLETCLQKAESARIRLIVTDGVFSMDGIIADLKGVCDLADKYNALVMVDDSHAVGFIGEGGKGSVEHCGVASRVDVITGTLGKALGGASGGYTAARKPIVDILRQRSRPYLFSNTVAPAVVSASLKVLDIVEHSHTERQSLKENTAYFRREMVKLGFDITESTHPIVAVMLYDARLAGRMAERLLELGVYVVAFSFPVVPNGKARIRTQVSAAHTRQDLDTVLQAFAQVKKEMMK